VSSTPGTNTASGTNVEIWRCPIPNIIGFEFRQLNISGKTKSANILSTTFDEITSDFNNKYTDVTANPFGLFLNQAATSTQFTFKTGNVSNTLALNYKTTTSARYRVCGTQTFIDSLYLGNYTFDSVQIAKNANNEFQRTLTDPFIVNVQVYVCPVTNMVQMAFRKQNVTATRIDTVENKVNLLRIRTDYSTDIFYENTTDISTVQLPLNPSADVTTFFFDYADNHTEEVTLNYQRSNRILINACKQQTLFYSLKEADDLLNVKILKSDSVQFPSVTNLEIYPK
jgi:hypothetical protein